MTINHIVRSATGLSGQCSCKGQRYEKKQLQRLLRRKIFSSAAIRDTKGQKGNPAARPRPSLRHRPKGASTGSKTYPHPTIARSKSINLKFGKNLVGVWVNFGRYLTPGNQCVLKC